MGRKFKSVNEYKVALDEAVKQALQDPDGPVQKGAKKAIQNSIQENVYDAYPMPLFMSRRGKGSSLGGGIMNEDNMISYSTGKGFTVTIQDQATWQQLKGGAFPSTNLAEELENNAFYGAPPRPFMSKAEDRYGESEFGENLLSELIGKGF